MKLTFFIHVYFLLLCAVHSLAHQDLIVVAGTSSVGKTTLTRCLKSSIPHAVANGRDEIMAEAPRPKKYIEESMSRDAYDQYVDDHYLNFLGKWIVSQKSNTVIADVLSPAPIREKLGKASFNIFKVLLYLPLDKYGERLDSRNKAAIKAQKFDDVRDPLDMVLQYGDVFRLSENDEAGLKMPITKSSMHQCLQHFADATVELLKSFEGDDFLDEIQDGAGREKAMNQLMQKLFAERDKGYLVPQETYDLIINTADLTPEETCSQVLKAVSK